jgi:lysine 2,3-aminomutase
VDEEWRRLIRTSITTAEELSKHLDVNVEEVARVVDEYPMRISDYYMKLAKEVGDPILRQAVPTITELEDTSNDDDPLNEDGNMPVPNLTHRYPDRALLLVTNQCPMYCRFCTRKRKVGKSGVTRNTIQQGVDYIAAHPEIRDVILSGGDPLMLSDDLICDVLAKLRAIPHLLVIRIGTKVPCTLPQRVTPQLVRRLKKYHPLYINTHFNHPAEVTKEAKRALTRLVNAGIPVGNQAVLLKGVNDDATVLKELFLKLLAARVRPYYLYQADLVKGTEHFRTKVEKLLELYKALRGKLSGLAIPTFVVDGPGGGGKIPLLPNYVEDWNEKEIVLRSPKGFLCRYNEIQDSPLAEELVGVDAG